MKEKLTFKKGLIKVIKSKVFWIIVAWFISLGFVYWFRANYHFQNPVVIEIKFRDLIEPNYKTPISDKPIKTLTPQPKKESLVPKVQAKEGGKVRGQASYYKFAPNSINCDDPNCIMANGEALDDSKLTVALPPEVVQIHNLLNKNIKITNIDNGNVVIAKVTDTGGFSSLGRIADLSVATKDALGCDGLCNIEITY